MGQLDGSEQQIESLTRSASTLIVPNDDDDLNLTHWWELSWDGVPVVYIGTPETFQRWQDEEGVTAVTN